MNIFTNLSPIKPGKNILGWMALILFSLTIASAQSTAPQTTFTNSAAINIPTSGTGSLYPSPITVSGISGNIPTTPGSIKVTINGFSHLYPDDVGIALVSPTGQILLLQDGCDDDVSMSGVTYTFSDTGASQLPDTTSWTAGTYKPTSYYSSDSFADPGPGNAYSNPGPGGSGTATFASVFGGINPNGVWKLYVQDFSADDGGSISGGWSLEIAGTAVTPAKTQHVVDFNGDGKTDFALVRNIGGGTNGQLRWYVNLFGTAITYASDWGLASDKLVPADYDGDGKTDIAVWRPGNSATFYILQSQTNTLRMENFGQTGDDPTIVGDYDGDGKADLAVYRAGTQSFWYYSGSLNNPSKAMTTMAWGISGDVPVVGDFDGDGKTDCVIRRTSGGEPRFWLMRSTAGFDTMTYGTTTDKIVTGDFDGDGKTDLVVVRSNGVNFQWYLRPSLTGVVSAAPMATFGLSATDIIAPGDYDGDGKTDVAIWRPSSTNGGSAFWVLASSGGAFAVPNGSSGDIPAAGFSVR